MEEQGLIEKVSKEDTFEDSEGKGFEPPIQFPIYLISNPFGVVFHTGIRDNTEHQVVVDIKKISRLAASTKLNLNHRELVEFTRIYP